MEKMESIEEHTPLRLTLGRIAAGGTGEWWVAEKKRRCGGAFVLRALCVKLWDHLPPFPPVPQFHRFHR